MGGCSRETHDQWCENCINLCEFTWAICPISSSCTFKATFKGDVLIICGPYHIAICGLDGLGSVGLSK